MKKQAGFTLIELVMVIVIMGILAAVALPKFNDLGNDAKKAKAQGFAGALASAAAIQYARHQITSSNTYSIANACNGTYLQGGTPDLSGASCSGFVSGNTCAVTCDGQTATAVTLPEPDPS